MATPQRTQVAEVSGKTSVSGKREKPIRVMIVEDHPLTRLGISRILSQDENVEVCGYADDVDSAFATVRETQPDVVIVDLSLKTGTGIDLILRLKQNDEPTQTVVFSMHDESLYAEDAMRAGARGYVNKKAGIETLIEAIRRVIGGGMYLNPQFADQILRRISKKGIEHASDPIRGLSKREFEVFTRLGKGMSVRHIADDLDLSPKTIDTYRENIKNKLGVATSHDLMRMAVRYLSLHCETDE